MTTFICTVCQNRIKEYGTNVECGYYNCICPMVEDTTKLYDKSFLCKYFIHVRNKNKQTCKAKHRYKYKYDALKVAKDKYLENKSKRLRPYKCDQCGKWHLSSMVSPEYNPKEEYERAKANNKLYD